MSLYSLIIDNKWILEVAYALIIGLICSVIVFRTDKFFRLSLHKGIQYFRNAFLFFGLAFIARYLFGVISDLDLDEFVPVLQVVFEYLLVMAGFFLIYSLIWRKFESAKEKYSSSLFNSKIIIFHLMALVIAVLDTMWQTYYLMFFSEIVIFFYASIIAYINSKNDKKEHKFPRFYFIAMLLSLGAWILNFLSESYLQWNHGLLIDIGIINIIFFLLFLYGVIKVTKTK
jgi:hypothetical protein